MVFDKTQYHLQAKPGFGNDVASQREDDLDKACLKQVDRLSKSKDGRVLALDIGGANGAMSVKMAQRGAYVTLIDPIDNPEYLKNRSWAVKHVGKWAQDVQAEDVLELAPGHKVDVIYSQRAMHYLPYKEAVEVLSRYRRDFGTENCRLFISVTGVDSPLGEDYDASHHPIDSPARHARLHGEEATTAHISEPMTLYTPEELTRLLTESGFKNISIARSSRGTLKATAENVCAVDKPMSQIKGAVMMSPTGKEVPCLGR